jgi:hypothetical protein
MVSPCRVWSAGADGEAWIAEGVVICNRHRPRADTEDDKTSLPQAKQRRLSYVATLEVLPQ